jgi:predicted NAD/FAD-dependent oxidoreductase
MSQPLERASPIAVLGAGVSGLTFAEAMKRRGFTNVVVFERAPRVGGKSHTVVLDGRPHDLGATMGVPLDYATVERLTRQVGGRMTPFPRQRHYNLATGQERKLNRWAELPAVLAEATKYLLHHALFWRGADGTGLHRAGPTLHEPWSRFAARLGIERVSERLLTFRAGYGYGFDHEVPAVLYANLLRPTTFLGLAVRPAFMWEGGTQPLWESVARGLDVRTGVEVTRLERGPDGVVVHTKEGPARFDKVVITLNPRDALRLLDASDEETALFSAVRTYPYATFACEITGLHEQEASVGYIAENMVESRQGHPMAWVKRYADHNVFVFHLYAPPSLGDEAILKNIEGDLARLGARSVRLLAARRWDFFPHFPCEFMASGGLARIERWQGSTGAYLIGEAFSFATMARVADLAADLARRLAREIRT